jgi:hypothetical protein
MAPALTSGVRSDPRRDEFRPDCDRSVDLGELGGRWSTRNGLALALPEEAALARPTGVGRALATYEIPIEGRHEWLAAARRLA